MTAVFLDANVVIDFMDKSAKDHKTAYEVIHIIRLHLGKPVVSPFTFVIANYLFGKKLRDKIQHRERMQFVFSGFELAPIASSFAEAVFGSRFLDLEDAAQYQCALDARAELIVTKDVHDYFSSQIPVIHPLDFLNRYNSLLS